MKRFLLALPLLLFIFTGMAHAQGASYTAGPFNSSGLLYICPVPAGGFPCASPVNIFSDAALTQALTDPLPVTALQAVSFFVSPGQYTVQMPASGYSQVVQIGGSSSGGFTAGNDLSGTSTSQNVIGAHAINATVFQLPLSAGFTSSGTINTGIDSTNNNAHIFNGLVDLINLGIASAPTNGHVAGFSVSSGSVQVTDAGPATGGGTSFILCTPNGLLAGDYFGINNSGVCAETVPGQIFNNQTTTYPLVSADMRGKVVNLTSATAINATLPSAASLGNNPYVQIENSGTSSGTVTLKATTSTVNGVAGATGIPLPLGTWCDVGTPDNVNYNAMCSPGLLTAGANITLTPSPFGTQISASGGAPAYPVTITGGVSGGIPYFSSTTVESASPILNTNIVVKGGGAGNPPTNSLITDNGTTAAYTGTGGYVAPVLTTNGTGAGALVMTAGAAQGHATASTVTEEAPASATAYEALWPAAAATGVVEWTNTSNVVTESIVATTGTGSVVQATSPTLVTPVLGAATGTSLSVTGSLTSTVATGTAPIVVTSTTTVPNLTVSNHPKVQFCGTTSACSATAEVSPKIVFGSAPLVTGTPSTVTISGISPAFTATADYACTVTGPGSGAATNLYGWAAVSASSFTITGPATVTTVVTYMCVGF